MGKNKLNRPVRVIGRKNSCYWTILILLYSCSAWQKGEEQQFYPSGALKWKYTLEDGKREGKGYTYYEDGSMEQVSHWKNGLKDGTTTSFYRNGKKRLEANFVKGHQEGEVVLYDSLGSIRGRQNYSKSLLKGPFQTFYPSGALKIEGNYSDGGNTSTAFEYFESGRHKAYIHTKYDSLIYKKDFDEKGSIESCYFTIEMEFDGQDFCFRPSHSMIPRDSLGMRLLIQEGTAEEATQAYNSSTNVICISKEKVEDRLTGYLCEIFIPDSSNQGCAFLDISLEDLKLGEKHVFGSTIRYMAQPLQ